MINKLRARADNVSGFTLIELLIVIISLGILATIVLFATGQFTTDSKSAACKANAKILTIAEAAYSAANGGATSDHSATALDPYLQDNQFPTDNVPTAPGTGSQSWHC